MSLELTWPQVATHAPPRQQSLRSSSRPQAAAQTTSFLVDLRFHRSLGIGMDHRHQYEVFVDISNQGGPSRRSNPENKSFLIFSLRYCPEPGESRCQAAGSEVRVCIFISSRVFVPCPAVPLRFFHLSHLFITYLLTVVVGAHQPWAAGQGNAWMASLNFLIVSRSEKAKLSFSSRVSGLSLSSQSLLAVLFTPHRGHMQRMSVKPREMPARSPGDTSCPQSPRCHSSRMFTLLVSFSC